MQNTDNIHRHIYETNSKFNLFESKEKGMVKFMYIAIQHKYQSGNKSRVDGVILKKK